MLFDIPGTSSLARKSYFVDVDLELLLELVEVLLLSLATTHPAGWGGFEARSLEKLWKILRRM